MVALLSPGVSVSWKFKFGIHFIAAGNLFVKVYFHLNNIKRTLVCNCQPILNCVINTPQLCKYVGNNHTISNTYIIGIFQYKDITRELDRATRAAK